MEIEKMKKQTIERLKRVKDDIIEKLLSKSLDS